MTTPTVRILQQPPLVLVPDIVGRVSGRAATYMEKDKSAESATQREMKTFGRYTRRVTKYFLTRYGQTPQGVADVGEAVNKIFKNCKDCVSEGERRSFLSAYKECMFYVGKRAAELLGEDYPTNPEYASQAAPKPKRKPGPNGPRLDHTLTRNILRS